MGGETASSIKGYLKRIRSVLSGNLRLLLGTYVLPCTVTVRVSPINYRSSITLFGVFAYLLVACLLVHCCYSGAYSPVAIG